MEYVLHENQAPFVRDGDALNLHRHHWSFFKPGRLIREYHDEQPFLVEGTVLPITFSK